MQLTDRQARQAANRLCAAGRARGLKLSDTNALDIVCPAYGLPTHTILRASQDVADEPSAMAISVAESHLPSRGTSGTEIGELAQRIAYEDLSADAAWIQLSIEEKCWPYRSSTVPISRGDLASPEAFVGSAAGAATITAIAGRCAYYRYYRDGNDRPLELRQGTALAERILQAGRQNRQDGAIDALEKFFGFGQDPAICLRENASGAARETLDAITEEVPREHGSAWPPDEDRDRLSIVDGWIDAIEEATKQKMATDDDSKATDLLGSHDRAEIVVILGRNGLGAEDNALQSHKAWSEPSEIAIDVALQHALAPIGYSVEEYRKLFANKHRSEKLRSRPRIAATRLVEPKALCEAIENACTTWFVFCLYAIVPVTDPIGLDTSKSITLTNAHFAAYNPMSGTFHDSRKIATVVLRPEQCEVATSDGWYGPDEIRGLVQSRYHGSINNTVDGSKTDRSRRR